MHHARPTPLLYALAIGLTLAPSAAHPQQAKVDAQIVAPNEQDMAYSISPKGAHLVAISQKGTRWVVLHDGVAGPLFDQIISDGGGVRINFSPDGSRFGYVGRQGQEWVAMVDGKVTPPPARMWASELTFSPDGLRAAYAVTAPGGTSATIMVDGKPQASSTSAPFGQIRSGLPVQYIWSPDSKTTMHYGYPGTQYTGQFALFLGDRTVVFEFDGQGRGPLSDTGNWAMGADGTLTFIVQTVEGFKRVRVTPGADNGVEAMLARGKVVR